mmetsp:Transcript_17817/g.52740  ORF Transcript_17817/g.52740 Transcript_17817/m.52740 type:complete len:380 (+) Transcript_17817:120-1259(+)
MAGPRLDRGIGKGVVWSHAASLVTLSPIQRASAPRGGCHEHASGGHGEQRPHRPLPPARWLLTEPPLVVRRAAPVKGVEKVLREGRKDARQLGHEGVGTPLGELHETRRRRQRKASGAPAAAACRAPRTADRAGAEREARAHNLLGGVEGGANLGVQHLHLDAREHVGASLAALVPHAAANRVGQLEGDPIGGALRVRVAERTEPRELAVGVCPAQVERRKLGQFLHRRSQLAPRPQLGGRGKRGHARRGRLVSEGEEDVAAARRCVTGAVLAPPQQRRRLHAQLEAAHVAGRAVRHQQRKAPLIARPARDRPEVCAAELAGILKLGGKGLLPGGDQSAHVEVGSGVGDGAVVADQQAQLQSNERIAASGTVPRRGRRR